MLTVTGSTGSGSGTAAKRPSVPPGLACPAPVTYNETQAPALAGRAALFNEPSWLIAAAGPAPDPFNVNRPGATVASDRLNAAELWPWYCTKSWPLGAPVAKG